METTGGDEYQARSNGNQERHPENESSSIASVASMDSSGSNLSSSKDAKTNDSRNTSSNISELVGKSKKAAFSLWTLLHAKVRYVKWMPLLAIVQRIFFKKNSFYKRVHE